MLAPTPMAVRMGAADAARAAQAMSRQLMQVREYEAAMPRGWIGFVAQGPGLEPRVEDGQLIVRYFSYPRILSVDPSSPAQRAGIATNDTLLAYDGHDVRENDISLTRLLRPNARVRVRVLRDGRVHEFPVTVATAPAGIARRRGVEVGGERETWNIPEGPSFPRIAMVPQGSVLTRSGPRIVMSTQQPGIAALHRCATSTNDRPRHDERRCGWRAVVHDHERLQQGDGSRRDVRRHGHERPAWIDRV